MKLEDKILLLRKQKGMSLEGLARKLKVTRQAVYKWEAGICRPEIEKIVLLAQIFNVSVESLIDDNVNLSLNVKIASEENQTLDYQNNNELTNESNSKPTSNKIKSYLLIALSILVAIAIAIIIVVTIVMKNQNEINTDTDNTIDTTTNTNTDTSIDKNTDTGVDKDNNIDAEVSINKDGLGFQIIDGKNEYQLVSVTNKQQTRIDIPSTYKGLPVTRINSYSCYGCSSVKEISIPVSIKYIDSMAFIGVGGNPSVDYNVEYPSLRVYYDGSLENWCQITFGHGAFTGSVTALYIDNKQIRDLIIPEAITEIKPNTFSFFHFASIEITENVKAIGYRAFYFAETYSIEFKNGLETIGEGAFEYFEYNSAYDFQLPSTLKRIEKRAFASTDLDYFKIPSSVTYIGNQAFFSSASRPIIMDNTGIWDILDLDGNAVGTIEGEKLAEASLRMLLGDENSKYAYRKQG